MRIIAPMMILIMVASITSGCFGGEDGEEKYEIKDTSTIIDAGFYYMVGSSEGRVTGYNSYSWELDYTAQTDSSSDFSWDVYVLKGINCDNYEDRESFVYLTLTTKNMTESGSMERQGTDSNDDFCFIVDNIDGDESMQFSFRVYGWK